MLAAWMRQLLREKTYGNTSKLLFFHRARTTNCIFCYNKIISYVFSTIFLILINDFCFSEKATVIKKFSLKSVALSFCFNFAYFGLNGKVIISGNHLLLVSRLRNTTIFFSVLALSFFSLAWYLSSV